MNVTISMCGHDMEKWPNRKNPPVFRRVLRLSLLLFELDQVWCFLLR